MFQAALYCEDCGQTIGDELAAAGVEDTGDSDTFPQGPYPDGGGEADAPQHCDSGARCLNAEVLGSRKVGVFLENPLTEEGRRYVSEASTRSGGRAVARRWSEHYGI